MCCCIGAEQLLMVFMLRAAGAVVQPQLVGWVNHLRTGAYFSVTWVALLYVILAFNLGESSTGVLAKNVGSSSTLVMLRDTKTAHCGKGVQT